MSKQYKTPGVYVVEKDAFGSSIVANATAVPIFIGFTEVANHPSGEALPYFKIPGQTRPAAVKTKIPYLINSMLEYTQCFGGPDTTGILEVSEAGQAPNQYYTSKIVKGAAGSEKAYQPSYTQPAVSNYFTNGGGSCYILSLGRFEDFDPTKIGVVNLDIIIKAIEEAEQCTLIMPIDLIRFGTSNYYNWANQFLDLANESKEQFCVLDVIMNDPKNSILNLDDVDHYRSGVTSENLKYAGAYYPYLKSLTSYAYSEDRVKFDGSLLKAYSTDKYLYSGEFSKTEGNDTTVFIRFNYKTSDQSNQPNVTVGESADTTVSIVVENNAVAIKVKNSGKTTTAELEAEWNKVTDTMGYTLSFAVDINASAIPTQTNLVENNLWRSVGTDTEPLIVQRAGGLASTAPEVKVKIKIGAFTMDFTPGVGATAEELTITSPADQSIDDLLKTIADSLATGTDPAPAIKAADYKFSANPKWVKDMLEATEYPMEKYLVPNNAKINDVRSFLATNFINMPPSPFMAGIYSRLDNATGVWTPPANVAPNGISGPVVNLTNKQQEDFNVDAMAGKSINAIRSFTGKGTLVWGARTNDGNSLDWRYVNVVRLFISMETDISMALEAFVFKPNVFNTWVEVKTMINSYLFGLFNQGAFAGTTPETSYQVQIGVGETMTDEDVLNGYMRATILVAPVRPAEFIVLTFSQMIGQ